MVFTEKGTSQIKQKKRVEEYIYLGQTIISANPAKDREIKRRIRIGCSTAYGKHGDVMNSNLITLSV